MSFETTMSCSKAKMPLNDIFDEEFLKEKDDALKPIEFCFELKEENEVGFLITKNVIKTIKNKSKDKMINTFNFKTNVILIESDSENTSESIINEQIQKEIKTINIQKRI